MRKQNARENVVNRKKRTGGLKELKKYFRKDQLEILSMMLPVIIQIFIFCYIPMAGAIVAFKKYKVSKGIWGSEWIGFKNFEFFFKSLDAERTIRNTLTYNAIFIVMAIICSVFVAILLSMIRSKKALKVYQTTLLFPHFLSWVVVAFMALTFLEYSSGILNRFLNSLGFESISWYSEAKFWPIILVVIYLWKVIGNNSLIYYASIINIDSELYESAALDGCTSWQMIRYIMLPMIKPTVIILAILAVGNIFRADFGLFYNVTNGSSAILSTTDVVDTYIYRTMFVTGDIGISAAVGLIQSIIGLILVVTVNKIAKRVDEDLGLF